MADDQRQENIDENGARKSSGADAIDKNDPHKVEKLSKLGSAGDEAAEGEE